VPKEADNQVRPISPELRAAAKLPRVEGPWDGRARWRGSLRRELALLMLLKFVAMLLLWSLFFSPVHQLRVSAQTAGVRLGVVVPATQSDVIANGAPRRD
jgi:hypothetical protein